MSPYLSLAFSATIAFQSMSLMSPDPQSSSLSPPEFLFKNIAAYRGKGYVACSLLDNPTFRHMHACAQLPTVFYFAPRQAVQIFMFNLSVSPLSLYSLWVTEMWMSGRCCDPMQC